MMNDDFPTVIICDFAARGDSNKHVVVGIYSGDIIIPSYPALVRLALYVEFHHPMDGAYDLDVAFEVDGEIRAGVRGSIEGARRGEIGTLIAPPLDLHFLNDALLKVVAKIGEKDSVTIAAKKVLAAPS